MSLKSSWIFLLICVFSLVSTSAYAEDKAAEDFANRMVEAAETLKGGQMWDGLEQYLVIASLYSAPEVNYALGRTYQRLHQCSDALTYYYKVITSQDIAEDNPIYMRTVEALDKIGTCADWGGVTLQCQARGAELVIDGEKIGRCKDRVYILPDGEHTIEGSGIDGTFKQTVTVSKGKFEDVTVKIDPKAIEVVKVEKESHHFEYEPAINPVYQWTFMGVGAALLVTSGFMLAYSYDAKYIGLDAKHVGDTQTFNDAKDAVDMTKIISWSLVGAGAATFLTGVSLWIANAVLDPEVKEVDAAVQAGIAVTPSGANLSLSYRF